MRCKYTKFFSGNLQYIANFLCFWVKFAVYCNFLSVKLITLSVKLITFL